MEQILDDLGSLSDPGRMAQTGSERWRWLQPWTWILGVWGTAQRQADFVLDVTVRGRGLETCSGVQACSLLCALFTAHTYRSVGTSLCLWQRLKGRQSL